MGLIKYVVQAQRGPKLPDGEVCFVDCRTCTTLDEARDQERAIRYPGCWADGVPRATRIVRVEDSNCYGQYLNRKGKSK